MLHAAKVSVWARWFIWLVGVVELAYRPGFWYADDKSYLLLSVPLVAVNGFLHYRLRRNQTVTWRWLLFLSAMDIALITAAVIIGGEFHLFSYVAYYPALALFAVVFTSLPLSLAWTTVVAIVYAGVSLTVGLRPRLRCRPGEGPARQSDGHVRRRRVRRPDRPVRTGQAAGGHGTDADNGNGGAAPGAH